MSRLSFQRWQSKKKKNLNNLKVRRKTAASLEEIKKCIHNSDAAEGSNYFTDPLSQSALSMLACFNRPPPGPSDQPRQPHCGTDWSYFIGFTQPEGDSETLWSTVSSLTWCNESSWWIHLCPRNQQDLFFFTTKIQAAIVVVFFPPPH